MLQEIEQFATLLMKKNSQDQRTQDLIKVWEQRYQSTQVYILQVFPVVVVVAVATGWLCSCVQCVFLVLPSMKRFGCGGSEGFVGF